VASGIVGAACFPLGGWAGDRFGRRSTGLALAAATTIAVATTFVAGSRAGYWAGNIIWSALASATAPVTGAWFAELFPTRARATSEAVAAVAAAVGIRRPETLHRAFRRRVGTTPDRYRQHFGRRAS
jgi:MFS family permease